MNTQSRDNIVISGIIHTIGYKVIHNMLLYVI